MERTPLMQPGWYQNFKRILENPYAPRWTAQTGDRLTHDDLMFVCSYSEMLNRNAEHKRNRKVPDGLTEWIQTVSQESPLIAQRLQSAGIDPGNETSFIDNFYRIEPLTRYDLQQRLAEIVPLDAEISRIVVNPTSGTTGRPVQVPNHPKAVGCYDPLIQYAFRRAGVEIEGGEGKMAAIQTGYMQNCMTYAAVHSYYDGAGFAKLNMNPGDWNDPDDFYRFTESLGPQVITGEPFSFTHLLQKMPVIPFRGMLSTAVSMPPELKSALERKFTVPVIDMYSANETGPVAATIAANDPSMYRLSPDIYIEVTDERFQPLPEGEKGEILISGGRNPMLPLLRYRTGDRGRIGYSEDHVFLYDLDLRHAIYLDHASGSLVNPVDITRMLRQQPVKRHRLIQHKDRSISLELVVYDSWLRSHYEQILKGIESLTGFTPDIHTVADLPESTPAFVKEDGG